LQDGLKAEAWNALQPPELARVADWLVAVYSLLSAPLDISGASWTAVPDAAVLTSGGCGVAVNPEWINYIQMPTDK
jgi:hypothetical protein